MKIAIDCRMSGKSGIGTYLDSMLPTFISSGNKLLLIGLPPQEQEKIIQNKTKGIQNCEFVSCAIKNFSLKEMFAFPKDLLKKINSCAAYFTPYCNIPGRLFSKGIRIPIFCTIHDIIFLDLPEIAGKTGTFIRKIIYKRAIQLSAQIFTVSQFSKNRIIEKLKCKKNITVVYSGVPLYNEEEANLCVKKDNTIIFVGNIKKHKGLGILIPAFIKFKNANKENPKLLIVGSKENFRTQDTTLEKMILEAEQNGIEFTGFVPDEELKTLIDKAKLLVQPSLYEGFGVPPLQALYSGTKALISDIPVFKEIYEKLPVAYFKCGDVQDLAQKLGEVYFDETPLPEFEKIYSYKKSAALILKSIETNC